MTCIEVCVRWKVRRRALIALVQAAGFLLLFSSHTRAANPFDECQFSSYSIKQPQRYDSSFDTSKMDPESPELPPAFKIVFGDADKKVDIKTLIDKREEIIAYLNQYHVSNDEVFMQYSQAVAAGFLEKLKAHQVQQPTPPKRQGTIEIVAYAIEGMWSNTWLPEFMTMDLHGADTVKLLDTPWVRARLTMPDGACKLDVFLIWNHRQFIADQAYLNGIRPIKNGPVTQFDDKNVNWFRVYDDYVSELPMPVVGDIPSLPPELFWFFRKVYVTPTGEDGFTFSAQLGHLQRSYFPLASKKQEWLTSHLLWQLIVSEPREVIYHNIMEVDSFSLRLYWLGNG